MPAFLKRFAIDTLHFATDKTLQTKVLHAEPLFIDLIRDLGARKGEREWNVGAANVDRLRFDRYEALIEYVGPLAIA